MTQPCCRMSWQIVRDFRFLFEHLKNTLRIDNQSFETFFHLCYSLFQAHNSSSCNCLEQINTDQLNTMPLQKCLYLNCFNTANKTITVSQW